MSEEEVPELMTVKETAEYLRIPLPTVYYLVQRGQLPAIQIGGRWRIKRSLLDRDILKTDEGGQPTVLVVDDDPALQTLFKQFLKKAGFGRIVVGTGAEALTYAEKYDPEGTSTYHFCPAGGRPGTHKLSDKPGNRCPAQIPFWIKTRR